MCTYRMPAALPVPDVQDLGVNTMLPGLRGLAKLAAFAHSFPHSFAGGQS
jgi:hypothetical protein